MFINEIGVRIYNRWKLIVSVLFINAVFAVYLMQLNHNFAFFSKVVMLSVLEAMSTILILAFSKKIWLNACLVILSLGTISSIITPILDGPDEPAHFVRSLFLADGHPFLSPDKKQLKVSVDYEEVKAQSGKNFFQNTLEKSDYTNKKKQSDDLTITNAYSFIGYIPQAVGVYLGKVLHLNLLSIFYLGRMMNVLAYALLSALAIKLAKGWEIPIATVALIPISVYISGSYNQDSVSSGLILLTISYFLHLLVREKPVSIKDQVIFSLLSILLATVKLPYIALGGLLLFIPPSKFKRPRDYIYVFPFILGIIACGLGWFSVYMKLPAIHTPQNVNVIGQVSSMIHNVKGTLLTFLDAFVTIISKFNMLFTFGWFTYGFYELALLFLFYFGAIVFLFPQKFYLPRVSRMGLGIISFGISLIICLSMYVSWTSVGAAKIEGIQGRYFIGVMAMLAPIFNLTHLFIPEAKETITLSAQQEEKIAVTFCTISLIFVVAMLNLSVIFYYK